MILFKTDYWKFITIEFEKLSELKLGETTHDVISLIISSQDHYSLYIDMVLPNGTKYEEIKKT